MKKRRPVTRKRKSSNSGLSILKSLNEVNNKAAKRSSFATILIIIIIVAGLMIGSIWQKVRFSQMAAEIEKLQKQEHDLIEHIDMKRAEVYNLLNDSRIVNIATSKLDMVSNPPFEVISANELMIKYDEIKNKLDNEDKDNQAD